MLKKSLTQRSRHPLREGRMDCSSCHNPHGSGTDRMIRADSVNDQCFLCHREKRGPFLWEHSPVREDCLTCHAAHGSNHDKMLVARTVQLCQSCHLQGRHQTVAGLETAFWNTNRQCLNCHSQIHGSNHPSGPLFQR
jgi:DmsE family decaheme c-type cytochrome